MKYTKKSAFINRKKERSLLDDWVKQEAENILFIYGPKSSGKTTLLYKFVKEVVNTKKYEVKYFNLREILIANYKNFIQAFFEIDYSKSREDIKEKREYNLKVFKLTTEIFKGIEDKEFDPFAVMKTELQKLAKKNIRPIIIIDELQALEDIYMNGQRALIKELFNFFVAMTKESHLCHIIIASSDGYFIEKIYNDSKLKKTSTFFEIDYLNKTDVYYWLDNLEKESAITSFTLTNSQKDKIWKNFGGSCWEISAFLGDLIGFANNGKVNNKDFNSVIETKLIAARSLFVDYAGLDDRLIELFKTIDKSVREKGSFEHRSLATLVKSKMYDNDSLRKELKELVRQNFLYYDSTKALYKLQGSSMENGLSMYAKEY